MKRTIQIPSYCHHKPTNTARVWLYGRYVSLGRYDSPSSYAKYDRLIAEWRAAGCPTGARQESPTVAQLALVYWAAIEPHYPVASLNRRKLAIRVLRKTCGPMCAAEFGPRSLKAVRQVMIDSRLCRKEINARVQCIRGLFKWAVEEELVEPSVWHGLQAVRHLQRGRTDAPERPPVVPVPIADVEATMEATTGVVGAMIRLQLLTGMRPGEVCAMTTGAIDRSGSVWFYRVENHKTAHHGHERVVAIGPKAKEILTPRLNLANVDAPIFSPAASEAERLEAREAARTTPRSCGNRRGTNRKAKPRRRPRDRYTTSSYAQAVRYACERAGVTRWTPNQLRHTRATEIRRTYGLEAASAVLGHSNVETTQVYAERDLQIMLRVAQETG